METGREGERDFPFGDFLLVPRAAALAAHALPPCGGTVVEAA